MKQGKQQQKGKTMMGKEDLSIAGNCEGSCEEEVRQLIRDCDHLISGLESDLVLARCGLKGSKRNKGSKYNTEIRQLIRDCDELINDLESDLSIGNRYKRVDNCKDVVLKKEFKAECAELVQGIYLDVLAIKLKDPSKRKNLLKRCDKLIEEVENDRQIGKTACRHQMAKLLHKCQ